MSRVLVLHGPNLNLLGRREPEIYGTATLQEINDALTELGRHLGLEVHTYQSNHEGGLIDRIQGAVPQYRVLIINPAAYTHTSVGIRDAVVAVSAQLPTIEVHLSIPEARETFRHKSLIADVVQGRISGFGPLSYLLALRAASELIRGRDGSGNQ